MPKPKLPQRPKAIPRPVPRPAIPDADQDPFGLPPIAGEAPPVVVRTHETN